MMVWDLCAMMTENNPKNLESLLNYIVNQPEPIPQHNFKPKILIGSNGFRSLFGDGVQSIFQNIPRPLPQVIASRSNFLCFWAANSMYSDFKAGNELFESSRKMMGPMYNGRPVGFILPITLQEDASDPRNVKQNKNKVSVCMMSAATPHDHIHW